jgi:hypothetical protein
MEQAEQVDMASNRTERAYEKYGWVILLASTLLGIFAAVFTTLPPRYVISSPIFENAYPIIGALGIALVGFNIFALVMILIPFRRGERWAWYTLWMLPLFWLSQFVLAADLPYYLVLAIITSVGLVLPYRRFFSSPDESSA